MEWLTANFKEVAIGIVALIVVWKLIRLVLPKKNVISADMTLNVACKACRWQGIVTKYNKVCRKCNSRDLDVLKSS
jgi:ubiquitin